MYTCPLPFSLPPPRLIRKCTSLSPLLLPHAHLLRSIDRAIIYIYIYISPSPFFFSCFLFFTSCTLYIAFLAPPIVFLSWQEFRQPAGQSAFPSVAACAKWKKERKRLIKRKIALGSGLKLSPLQRPLFSSAPKNHIQEFKPAEALHGTSVHKAQVCYSSARLSALEHEPPSEQCTRSQAIGKNHGGPGRCRVSAWRKEWSGAVWNPTHKASLGSATDFIRTHILAGILFLSQTFSFLRTSHLFSLTVVPGALPNLRSISEVPFWLKHKSRWIQTQLAAASASSGRH